MLKTRGWLRYKNPREKTCLTCSGGVSELVFGVFRIKMWHFRIKMWPKSMFMLPTILGWGHQRVYARIPARKQVRRALGCNWCWYLLILWIKCDISIKIWPKYNGLVVYNETTDLPRCFPQEKRSHGPSRSLGRLQTVFLHKNTNKSLFWIKCDIK